MANDIELEFLSRKVVSISFNEKPQRLNVTRAASGFALRVPTVARFRTVQQDEPLPVITGLWGEVLAKESSGGLIAVGRLHLEERVMGGVYYSPQSSSYSEQMVGLIWTGTFADLAYFEKAREGGEPKLFLNIHGEFCFLVPGQHQHLRVRTEPQRIYSNYGYVEVSYPKETWVQMLRDLGVAENVLVEVPLPAAPPGDWAQVWSALVEARNSFEQGGSTGWKGCVTGVRLALERWQAIEKEDMGPGWKSPAMQERKDRTKKQRFDNLRWHLYQCAHLGAHSSADEWTRDDALLLLSILSALLAERNP